MMAIPAQQNPDFLNKGLRWDWPADADFRSFKQRSEDNCKILSLLKFEWERDPSDLQDETSSAVRLKLWIHGLHMFRVYCEPQRILVMFQSRDLIFCRRHEGDPERTVFEFSLALRRLCKIDTFTVDAAKGFICFRLQSRDELTWNNAFELSDPSSPATLRRQRIKNGTDENNPFIGPLLPDDKFFSVDDANSGVYWYELLQPVFPRGSLSEPRDAVPREVVAMYERKRSEFLARKNATGGELKQMERHPKMQSSELTLSGGGDSTRDCGYIKDAIMREKEALVWGRDELPYQFIGLDRDVLEKIRAFYRQKLQRANNSFHGHTGIDNVGNSCFMSCVLQALCNTREFRDYFLSSVYEFEANPNNPLASEGCRLLRRFAEFMNELWLGGCVSVKPTSLRRYIADKNEIFGGYGQQDAQEFLQFLLDGLHEDLNRVKKKTPTADIECKGKSDAQLFNETLGQMLKWQDSVVMDLFYGFFKNTMECLACNEVSTKFDPFLFLPLPLPEPQLHVSVMYVPYFCEQAMVKFEPSFGRNEKLSVVFDLVSAHCDIKQSHLRAAVVRGAAVRSTFLASTDRLVDLGLQQHLGDTIFVFQSRCTAEHLDMQMGEIREFFVVQKLASKLALPAHIRSASGSKEICQKCGLLKLEKKCTACRTVSYCSSECQKADWAVHKQVCLPYKHGLVGTPVLLCMHVNEAAGLRSMIAQKVVQYTTVYVKSDKHAYTVAACGDRNAVFSSSDDAETQEQEQPCKPKRPAPPPATSLKVSHSPVSSTQQQHRHAVGASGVASPSPPSSITGGGQADSGIASETHSECDSITGGVSNAAATGSGIIMQPYNTISEADDDSGGNTTPPVINGRDSATTKLRRRSGPKSTAPALKSLSPLPSCNTSSIATWPSNFDSLRAHVEADWPFRLFGLFDKWQIPVGGGDVQFTPPLESEPPLPQHGFPVAVDYPSIVFHQDWLGDVIMLQWKTDGTESFQDANSGNPLSLVWVETRRDLRIVEDASCRLRNDELKEEAMRRQLQQQQHTTNEEEDDSQKHAQGDGGCSSSFTQRADSRRGSSSNFGGSSRSASFYNNTPEHTLIDLIEHFTRPEILRRNAEAWKCPNCNTRGESVKRLRLWTLPPILIFQLKRFSEQQQSQNVNPLMASFYSSAWQTMRVKKNDLVEYPQVLDLSSCVDTTALHGSNNNSKGDYLYDLYAIVFHHGQAHYGHYTAACRLYSFPDTSSDLIPWRSCDDNSVTTIPHNNQFGSELVNRNAYLLFYRRRQHRATIHLGGFKMTLPDVMHDADMLDEDDDSDSHLVAEVNESPLVALPAAENVWQGPLPCPDTISANTNKFFGSEYGGRGYNARSSDCDDRVAPTTTTLSTIDSGTVSNTKPYAGGNDILDDIFINNVQDKPGSVSYDTNWNHTSSSYRRRQAVDYNSASLSGSDQAVYMRSGAVNNASPATAGGINKDQYENYAHDYDSPPTRLHCSSPVALNGGGLATDDLERLRNLSGGGDECTAEGAHATGGGSDVAMPTFDASLVAAKLVCMGVEDDDENYAMPADDSSVDNDDDGSTDDNVDGGCHEAAAQSAANLLQPFCGKYTSSKQHSGDVLCSRSPQLDRFIDSLPGEAGGIADNEPFYSSPVILPSQQMPYYAGDTELSPMGASPTKCSAEYGETRSAAALMINENKVRETQVDQPSLIASICTNQPNNVLCAAAANLVSDRRDKETVAKQAALPETTVFADEQPSACTYSVESNALAGAATSVEPGDTEALTADRRVENAARSKRPNRKTRRRKAAKIHADKVADGKEKETVSDAFAENDDFKTACHGSLPDRVITKDGKTISNGHCPTVTDDDVKKSYTILEQQNKPNFLPDKQLGQIIQQKQQTIASTTTVVRQRQDDNIDHMD